MAIILVFTMTGCAFDEPDPQLLLEKHPEIFAQLHGESGESAYEVAVANGFEGTVEEWLQSLVGAAGQGGQDGQDGKDGKDGKDGIDSVCPECDTILPPVEERPNPFEVNDDRVHITVWYKRKDVDVLAFNHYVLIDGSPVLRSLSAPGVDENHTIEIDENNVTIIRGQYDIGEEDVGRNHAVGIRFNQLDE